MRRSILVCLAVLLAFAALGSAAAFARPRDSAHAASAVHITVIRSKSGGVAAAAKVIIHGRAFAFLIDTGATKTLINPTIARRLHLKAVGKAHRFCGVTGCSTARRVRLSRWHIGDQPLPSILVAVSPIAGTGGFGFGLLGSDVLSKFGAVTIDYRNKTLTLG